jgi:hypothetical protein
MTRHTRKARIPVSAAEPISFSNENWKSIQKAYGRDLSRPVRAYILFVTEALRAVSGVEKSAPTRKELISATQLALDALQRLLNKVGWPTRYGAASFDAIAERMVTAVKDFSNPEMKFFVMADSMFACCGLMLRRLEIDEGIGEGWMWDVWVQCINRLLKDLEYPSTARKDLHKNDAVSGNSAFVLMIDELQKHIPEELRRHTHSKEALAAAINRAKKSNHWREPLPLEHKHRTSPVELAASHERFRQSLANNPNFKPRGAFTYESIAEIS